MPRSVDRIPTSTARLDRRAAARDLWPGGTLAMWLGDDLPEPDRVFWPESDDDVLAVLEAAAADGRAVIPYGAGSGVCGGARGRPGAWVLDLKRLDRLGQVDPETWTVEVDAGVNGQRLEDALEAAGWTLGHSPSSILCSTVGGWAAARGAGQLSSRYGVFEDMILGLDAVAPGVGAFHVGLPGASSPAKRAPDGWMDLLLGSEGTLAVITRVRVRVRPVARARWLRGYRFADVPTALDAMRRLMQAELWPSAVRLYDPLDTLIGGKTKPKDPHAHATSAWWKDWLKAVDAVPAVRRRLLAAPLTLPGVIQVVGEGLASGCLLVVGFEGEPDVVEVCSQAGHALLCASGEDLGPGPGERWWASRHAVSYKLMPIFERGGFADTMEIAAPWSVLPHTYAAVRRALRPHALVMAHLSHLYPEGGCIYFSFAGRGDRATYEAVWKAAQEAVLASGATITHHHGVGELKAPWATREVGPAVAGWRALKATLDPAGVLNPGRLFVDAPPVDDPLPSDTLAPGDGLAWTRPDAPDVADRRWPWERLPCPPRWTRSAWQTGWLEVRGVVGGRGCALGRGPRSATGPDLRAWLSEQGDHVRCTVAVDEGGPRAMARAAVPHPWAAVRALLRADLRPGMVGVVDGVLHVGFRGPAAEALLALAGRVVPGLAPCPWTTIPLASGPLVACDADDPRAVAATSERLFRRAEASDG